MKKRFAALLLALCLLLAGSALAGDPVPEFTMQDQYGNTHNLSGYAGKIVFLNFWATWCPPCVAEMPEFEELFHELGENGEDVVILGVAGPNTVDQYDADGIASFLQENSLTYPVLMDGENFLWQAFPSEYIPFSLFVLPDGTLAEFTLPEGSKGSMIVGGIDKEYFKQALEEIRAALPAQE